MKRFRIFLDFEGVFSSDVPRIVQRLHSELIDCNKKSFSSAFDNYNESVANDYVQ